MKIIESVKIIEMFYDEYECNFGDGFYPLLIHESGFKSIKITFMQEYTGEIVWKQKTCGPIFGFDGTTGPDLLNILNASSAVNITKIFDVYGRQIQPKVA